MTSGEKPNELYPRVADYEKKLSELIQDTITVGRDMFSAAAGKVYMPDLFFVGVVNRSINLIDAILVLTGRWNFVAAGPLIRLHLDTLLRSSYLATTRNHDAFIRHILEGKQVNKLKDEKGINLTDTRLRDYARPIFPQIDNVYKETSRLIHFSNKHIFASASAIDEKSRVVGFSMTKGFLRWEEKDILSLLKCTIAITEAILAIARGWILQKAKMRNSVGEDK